MKKNLLFVIEELATNGAVMSLLSLLDAIHKDYDISLFIFLPGGNLMSRIPKNVKIIHSPLAYQVLRMPMKYAVKSMLKEFRFDMVYFRLRISFERLMKKEFSQWKRLPELKGDWDAICIYCDGFATQVAIKKIISGRKIFWIHSDYTRYRQSKETLNAFDRADCAVSVSKDSIKKFILAKGGAYDKPLYVVHNIIDKERCRILAQESYNKENSSEKRLKIVSVGRITYEKGFDLIPEICSYLGDIAYEWEIIGDGPDKEFITQDVYRRGLKDRVFFVGECSNPMPRVKRADMVVIPSRFEGWGMTLSEALVLGKPVVATDLAVFKEQVENDVNGILCPLEPGEFASAIKRVAGDMELRLKLSKEAEMYPFTKNFVKNEFKHVLENVLTLKDEN